MKRLIRILKRGALVAALALSGLPAFGAIDLVGDDTDLFTLNPNIPAQVPNVLIVLDNTSNWAAENQKWESTGVGTFYGPCTTAISNFGTQQGDAEICALYRLLISKVKNADGTDSTVDVIGTNVNIGMMMYEDLQQAGGYVRFPMRNMDKTNKDLFTQVVTNISTNNPGDKGPSSASPVNIFNDAFRYFNRLGTYSGVEAGKPGGPPSTLFKDPASPSFATIIGGAHPEGYTDSVLLDKAKMQVFDFPKDPANNSCGNDYIIFIGNGFPSTEQLSVTQADLTQAAALLSDPTVQVNTTPMQSTRVNPDLWSRFLFSYGSKVNNINGLYRSITTFTINVCNAQCDSDWETVMKSTATPTADNYYLAKNGAAILTALQDVFAKINAVNTVFAASTLPVSINVRGTNLNQVYIGVFRPDDNLSPRWWGNLKQYRLGVVDAASGLVELRDASDKTAVNPNSGFIFNTATSIWSSKTTPAGTPGFWAFRAPNYAPSDVGQDQDAPDGDLVEKGGAAQRIRVNYPFPDSPGQERKIYTCTDGSVSGTACKDGDKLSSFPFKAANDDITAEVLGTFASVKVDSLTGSGTTVTATIGGGHSFATGDQVVIEGASPSFYNGTFPVAGTNSPTNTTFTYTVTPVPGPTFSPTLAYVTFNVNTNTLNLDTAAGTKDLILVASAVPAQYNTTSPGAAIAPVTGTSRQMSYAISSDPGASASGYAVSGVRFVDSATAPATTSKVVYQETVPSTSGIVTVTLTNHGYATNNLVSITGGTDNAFNVTNAAITRIDANTFSYPSNGATATSPSVQSASTVTADPTASGFSWTSNQLVIVCKDGISHAVNGTTGVITTTCTTADNFNSATAGVTVQAPIGATSFNYTTSGIVSGTAAGFAAKLINTSTDINRWTVTAGSVANIAGNRFVTLTLGSPTHDVASQVQHTLHVGDSMAVSGIVCQKSNGTQIDCLTGATSGIASSYAITLTSTNGTTSATFDSNDSVASVTVSLGAATFTPSASRPTFSNAVAITSVTAGSGTVQASGTIYASKSGDLTSFVTSISAQTVATGTVTAARQGVADPNERANLIAWVRGADNLDNENQNGDSTDVRASVHGDVLHSRPAVVNYNRFSGDDDVFVFYGANDGMLHAIKGGAAGDGGDEQWAFVAPEFFGKLKRLRTQTPIISSSNPRGYFFDGSIAVYTFDKNKDGKLSAGDGDKVYLFITMRRGGRMMYALDVSDPVEPKLMWRKGCREATGNGTSVGSGNCDTGFGEMGQTWSQPTLGYLRAWPDKLALIVGAGYDKPAEDFQPCAVSDWNKDEVNALGNVVLPTIMDTTTCASLSGGSGVTGKRSMGRGVFILDAATGDILWRIGHADNSPDQKVDGMNFSVSADMVALRNRANTAVRANEADSIESVPTGFFDRLYVPDTGGNVWRIDVADASSPPKFPVTHLASIAVGPISGTHPALNYRKFMSSPDVVYASDGKGAYDAVLLGSGDREHVWDQVVRNRFYMFKDRNTNTVTIEPSPQTPLTESDLFDATTNCLQDAAKCSGSGDQATQADAQKALLDKSGWLLSLFGRRSSGAYFGEKTVAPATTAAGTVIFNTHEPIEETQTGSCSVLGTARQYGLNFQNATAANIFNSLDPKFVSASGGFATFAGGGFLPQPVPAVVKIGDKVYQTVIAGVQTTNPGGLKLQSRVRTYWYRKTD